MRTNNELNSVAESGALPRQERWDRAFAAPRQWLSFGVCHRSTLHAAQQDILDRLIEQCPGPWAPGEPLPPEVKVWCATYEGEVVGYMAYMAPDLLETTWLWDSAAGCRPSRSCGSRCCPAGARWEPDARWWTRSRRSTRRSSNPTSSRPMSRSSARSHGCRDPAPRARRFFLALGYRVLSGNSDPHCLERTSPVALDEEWD